MHGEEFEHQRFLHPRSRWFTPVLRSPAESRRLTRELLVFGAKLLGLVVAGRLAGKLEHDLRRSVFSEVMAVAEVICFASAAAVFVAVMPLRLRQPPAQPATVGRVWLAILLALAGLMTGRRFIHLCTAGSGLLEGIAFFGTPILIGVIMSCIKRIYVSVPLAVLVIAAVWLLARPYLDYVHGN